MEVRIARLDTCPKPSKVVGFTILHKPTGKSLYLDAFVPLEDCLDLTEHEITQKAWQTVKKSATQWVEDLEKKERSLVGSLVEI